MSAIGQWFEGRYRKYACKSFLGLSHQLSVRAVAPCSCTQVACHVGAYTSHLLNQADGRAQQNQVDEKAQHNQADESAKQVDSDATAKPLQKGCAATEDAGDKAVASAPSSNAGGHAKRHAGQRDQMNPCQELLLAVACATGVFFTVGFSCYLTRWLSGESATLFGEW